MQPTLTALRLNEAVLKLFLVPDEEVTVYINLPRLSMSASRLLGKRYEKNRRPGLTEQLRLLTGSWPVPLLLLH